MNFRLLVLITTFICTASANAVTPELGGKWTGKDEDGCALELNFEHPNQLSIKAGDGIEYATYSLSEMKHQNTIYWYINITTEDNNQLPWCYGHVVNKIYSNFNFELRKLSKNMITVDGFVFERE